MCGIDPVGLQPMLAGYLKNLSSWTNTVFSFLKRIEKQLNITRPLHTDSNLALRLEESVCLFIACTPLEVLHYKQESTFYYFLPSFCGNGILNSQWFSFTPHVRNAGVYLSKGLGFLNLISQDHRITEKEPRSRYFRTGKRANARREGDFVVWLNT